MQRGYIATLTVLIIMAVILTISTTTTYLSIGEAQSGLALFRGESTLAFVEGCVEDALLKIRSNPALSGTFTIGRPEGTCEVTINLKQDIKWTITVTAQDIDYKRNIQVEFERHPTEVILKSWKEI